METLLLTLGRLPKALDLARAHAAAGLRVVVAEPHATHLARPSRAVARHYTVPAPASDPQAWGEALLAIIRAEGVRWVQPVSEETLHVAALRDRLPPGVELLCMPAPRITALHDKLGFPAIAQRHGLTAPETCAAGDPAHATLLGSGPCVVKPRWSCAGRGLARLPRGAALPPAADGGERIVQRLIAGTEVSSLTVAREGEAMVTVVYRGLVTSGTVSVCLERIDAPAVEAWCGRFVRAEDWSGLIAFDFIVDAAGTPWAIECNPRATSGIHFLAARGLSAALRGSGTAPALRSERRLQQFYACLTEAWASVAAGRGDLARRLRLLASTQDVTLSAHDPLPFLLMTFTAWPILRRALFERCTLGEAATVDIEWQPGRGPTPMAITR